MNPGMTAWSPAESWMAQKLSTTRLQWTRRPPARLWQRHLGIMVQIESPDRDRSKDSGDDWALFENQAVQVIRVREFDEADAAEAVRAVRFAESWNARRRATGLPPTACGEHPVAVAKASRMAAGRSRCRRR